MNLHLGTCPQTQRPHRMSLASYAELSKIPEEFRDDGCTNWFDKVFRWSIRWCCRLHDYGYCSRCWLPWQMRPTDQKRRDAKLRVLIAEALPWRWDWTRWPVYAALRVLGGLSFNTCGPDKGDRCRHNMPMPAWMAAKEGRRERRRRQRNEKPTR